jgi:uncharacterized protein (TIGR02680 family)
VARLETLRADPANQDANRLENSERDAEARRRALEEAMRARQTAKQRSRRDAEEARRLAQRVDAVETILAGVRGESAAHAEAAGITTAYAQTTLAAITARMLVALPAQAFDEACAKLRALAVTRRKDLALIRQRLTETAAAEAALTQRREQRDEKAAAASAAIERRDAADRDVEAEGQALIDAWDSHLAALRQLTASGEAREAAMAALAEWVRTPESDNPARRLLQAAQQEHSQRSARRRVALDSRRQELDGERAALEDERSRLESGVDARPPVPHTRDAEIRIGREGAPLWQLIDFRPSAGDAERASIEAAIEASGLLDAWLSPDGVLQRAGADGTPILDVQVLGRGKCEASLDGWLEAAVPVDCAVPASIVTSVLAGIACAADDPGDCESWIAPDGRFRLGALAGAWSKPEAAYIGFAARAAARARRLAAIAERLEQLAAELATLQSAAEQLERDDDQAAEEWRLARADDPLRQAHVVAEGRGREAKYAGEQLAAANDRYREAEQALRRARDQLAADAQDLNLLPSAEALIAVEAALDGYFEAQSRLCNAAGDLRQAVPELERQCEREQEALDDLQRCAERSAEAHIEAEEAAARFAVLSEAVGAKVDELMRQLAAARAGVEADETRLKHANEDLRVRGETRAVAREKADTASGLFEQRSTERADAVAGFQRFAAEGLLLAAWPDAPIPDVTASWTIDPALTLARRTEQALAEIRHDDDAWARVQKEVVGDFTELQRALSARGHQAQAETSDWGLIVHVLYQNRPERPDALTLPLAEEIAQRNALLTAKEREILENHLQAEIAAEVQRLLQAADAQRNLINRELHRRPTSTGVRYRLLWLPLSEEEGAPVGLEAARKRLLNTNADLWTAEDRSVVGAMLQQRIAAERERADASAGPGDGSLADQLARALDYRRWHQFRVERWRMVVGASFPAPHPAANVRSVLQCRRSRPLRASTPRATTPLRHG